MRTHGILRVAAGVALLLTAGAFVRARREAVAVDEEREVQRKDLPVAALAALEKLAGGATIRELAEESEHGHVFYEGSWIGVHGNMDVLVTPSGDLVEIEESVPEELVPAAARAAAATRADRDSEITYEKKTLVLYEAHFERGGRERELILTPDGRVYDEQRGGSLGHDRDDE